MFSSFVRLNVWWAILTHEAGVHMKNFTYYNPVKIVFGRGTIQELASLIGKDKTILMTYGGGSIKKNGVYDQVTKALANHTLYEFGGIEPNPKYETLMKGVAFAKKHSCDYLLSVGGGSVLDGTKLMAIVIENDPADPWQDILVTPRGYTEAVPIGAVLTLPATGSEMNGNSVISRIETEEKLAFGSDAVLPKFSILDPETTYSLPERQTINGIVDAMIHVFEQYATKELNTPLQDREAESVLITLIEEGPTVLENPEDYEARANVMWCATHALNKNLGCGTLSDWSTHGIGHELTAVYGLDHAQTLAITMPGLWRHKKAQKMTRVIQYGRRVLGVTSPDDDAAFEETIDKTEAFWNSIGMKTKFSDYGIPDPDLEEIGSRIDRHAGRIGEDGDIGKAEVIKILSTRI